MLHLRHWSGNVEEKNYGSASGPRLLTRMYGSRTGCWGHEVFLYYLMEDLLNTSTSYV